MSAEAQISWDAQPQGAQQIQWDEKPPEKKSLFQRVRDVMPEGFLRRGLEAGSEWAGRKQQEAYDADLKEAAHGTPDSSMARNSRGAGYGMLSSLMRYGASAIQPKPVEAAIGAAAIAAPEITGPAMVAHGLYTAAANAPKAIGGNPEAAEAALLGGAEAAGGGEMAGKALRPGAPPTTTRKLMAATRRMAGDVIAGEPPSWKVPDAPKALTQATQPGVNIPRAQESIPIAGGRIQQLRTAGKLTRADGTPIQEIRSTGDLLDAVTSAKRHVWDAVEQRMGPVAELQADTSSVADAMERSITKRTQAQYKSAADAVKARASTYRGQMSLRDIEEAIQDANNDLRNMYKRSSPTDAPISPDVAATQAEVKALRNLLDEKVEQLGGEGVADLKREYGALRDVERATAKQHAVNTRTKEASLWEGLAYLHAAGDLLSGNVLGAARGAGLLTVGRMLKTLRNPDFLIGQSFHGPKAFGAAEPIAPSAGPPKPAGLLNAPPIEAGYAPGPDPSGPARDPSARWATPKAALPDEKPQVAKFIRVINKNQPRSPFGLLRESNTPPTNIPPMVDEKFAQEATGSVEDASRLGPRGRGGVRTTPKGALAQSAESLTPEKAYLLVKQTLDVMRSGDRPGRYFDVNEMGDYNPQREQSASRGVTAGGRWRGVGSMRDMLPWIQETEFRPAELERAIKAYEKSGKVGRVLQSAIDFVKRENGPRMREPGED